MIGKLKVGRNWTVLEVDHEIGRYYRKLFLRTFGIKLERPSNSEHISIISPFDSTDYTNILLPYMGELIEFDLLPTLYTNGNAFWLNVLSGRLEHLRYIVSGIFEQDLHFCIGYLNNGIVK